MTLDSDASTKKTGHFFQMEQSATVYHSACSCLFVFFFFSFLFFHVEAVQHSEEIKASAKAIKLIYFFFLCRIIILLCQDKLRWCCVIIAAVCITLNYLRSQSPMEALLALLRLN